MAAWSVLLALLVLLFALYIYTNDAKLTRTPPEALAVSPKRWTTEEIKACHAKLVEQPTGLFDATQLPPKTGRRYIVIGGAGFLGGWIVRHLLERGEDPRKIRVLDIRLPVRRDLLEGRAREVDFITLNITDYDAVLAAFEKPWPATHAADSPSSAAPNDLSRGATESNGHASQPDTTVFHTAAIIRFYERHPALLGRSEWVNVHGTNNILNAANRVGARTFVYTSSGSVCVKRSRFWLWPWQKEPKHFTQVISDDTPPPSPSLGEKLFSNYAESKLSAERLVISKDRSVTELDTTMRTGCIRPGNGIYGPGGDMLVAMYLRKGKNNPSWIGNIMQSFVYVENCSLAHLLYEQRLIELENDATPTPSRMGQPDIGGQAFCVADSGPPPTYGDVHRALNVLSHGETSFMHISVSLILLVAHLVEWYYLKRTFLLWSYPYRPLARLFPSIDKHELVFLQPSMFALTQVHLYFDDSRARLSPEKGGLGYEGCTTLEGVCRLVVDHYRNGGKGTERAIIGHVETNQSPLLGAEIAVGKVAEKLAEPIDVKKALN